MPITKENKLYTHQKEFIERNPHKALLCWECGLGKMVAGCLWLAKGRDNNALVVGTKRIIERWRAELKKWGAKATVVSKEQFKKMPIQNWSALVIDEADEFASPLFTKQRSQLSTALYGLIKAHPDMPILLLTATPIRSRSENLHSLLCFLGHYIPWTKWRDRFFSLERRPYLPRRAWFPKNNWRKQIRPYLEKYADIVLMRDCVNELPAVSEEIITLKSEPFVNPEWEPAKAFFMEHRHEQKNKVKHIQNIAKGYRKVLVVAYYVEQVEFLAKVLTDREVFMVHGGTKGQEQILKDANEADECYLVVQASLGVGWECPSFSCCIFASMSYSFRDWIQMKARIRRINDLHPIKLYYLLAGRCDKAILEQVYKGKDFSPAHWIV